MSGGLVYIESYGCQMNLADSELIAGCLGTHGYALIDRPEEADVLLVNTCAVRERAEERVIGRLADLASLKARRPGVRLGVCGCVAQHLKSELLARIPALDFVVGPDSYRSLPHLLANGRQESGPSAAVRVQLDRTEIYSGITPRRSEGVRAWVTIMRGCDRFCTFCIVPFVRGRERSRPAAEVLAEVRALARRGFKEVVFLGQTVTSYRDGQLDFAGLLEQAAEIEGIRRIRFTSPHPCDITSDLIRSMARKPKVAPQIHLPLQSGSDAILERMNRSYTVSQYLRTVDALRRSIADLAITTDVIVGFPGETENDFRATLAVMKEVEFDGAFMFRYSPRKGTKAFAWKETVTEEEKRARLSEVITLQEAISLRQNRKWVGREVEILVEGPARRQPHWSSGKTAQFKAAVVPARAAPGELVRATVVRATAHSLIAEPVGGG